VTQNAEVRHFRAGKLKLEIHPTSEAAGAAAASVAAEALKTLNRQETDVGVVFATGASQLSTLRALTSIPGLPWNQVCGFHLDEYVGLPVNHPASFRRYLREHLTQLVPMKTFFEIDGNGANSDLVCQEYIDKLSSYKPQLCLLGIGENGHLAFNDPDEADYNDPKAMKRVRLDPICRQQQFAEGWFSRLDEVPESALTLTIPTMFKVPKLVVSVPGHRKAQIVQRMLEEPISMNCPATILRTHSDATVYLDHESAADLRGAWLSSKE
jgi:glucosamine-6-phosphate deaminase